ncbi:DUF5642 family protein [Mycolicibacterium thermoresistibile]|uniref:DUF5642 domain-containing protein n=2 Tax=Mycolicibacterium thermoresistibile TaxID=1797 RepID=G7CCH5_MYCT3|nr:DUF5642 family protein [Mycolicibacterium thermoresistibile]EHI14438.1 hypothetical protein KEK_03351 [Mycolicibacterium thermoresistibile ATCC 19527]MCV7189601.1 DUF5642 family protein [Mycolicibacterium thermoresistibile]GAT14592.1 putative uncharacterized protein [Mycolicibacterium thermoresistibile]SNW19820.1 putative secreted protein [Mycolicibacterium thermoresistibile]
MRLLVAGAVTVLAVAACGAATEPPDAPPAGEPSRPVVIDPPRINRARGHLPPDYEGAPLPQPAAPATFWSLGPGWSAEPPQCAALADPAGADATAHGWSASGAGGIVYAMVASAPGPPDPDVLAHCGQWTVTAENTDGTVTSTPAPPVADAVTVAMATTVRTVVEGGTTTITRADTVSAYLDGHVVVVAIVSDPGLPEPPLGDDYAATLLTETVSELRV